MKYNYEQKRNDYQTPSELLNQVFEKLNISCFWLDTCCSECNVPAKFYYVEGKMNGLIEPWLKNGWNWCNPPFDKCKAWIEKAYQAQLHGCSTVMLLPVRTETKYWHDYILNNPNVEIEYLRKGLKFISPDTKEPMGVFKNALALVYFYRKENLQN